MRPKFIDFRLGLRRTLVIHDDDTFEVMLSVTLNAAGTVPSATLWALR
jgi:hypothetical protein